MGSWPLLVWFSIPKVSFGSLPPSREGLEKIHQLAHKECFIANSVRTSVTFEIY